MKRRKGWPRTKRAELKPAQQGSQVLARFPQFQVKGARRPHLWRLTGTLRPTEESPEYVVEIAIRRDESPIVTVADPPLDPNPPHCYNDRSLCLYDPRSIEWDAGMSIADTIVPWAAEWLFLYEIWKETGEWYGPEAPHEPDTEKSRD